MIITNIAVEYDTKQQKEIIYKIKLDEKLVKNIVNKHINNMDYSERKWWLVEEGVKKIDEFSE